jgi:hypothetical protein
MKLKITRAFLLAGQRQEVGAKIETPDRALAAMLVHTGKAVVIGAPEPSGPLTTETAAAAVPGKAMRVKAAPEKVD